MKLLIVLICFLTASCSLLEPRVQSSQSRDASKKEVKVSKDPLRDGYRALENYDFETAHANFEAYIQSQPVGTSVISAIFYSGVSLEGLERFSEAQEKFRTVLRLNQDRDNYTQAEALLHLARCYEGLKDYEKSLAAFRDLERRKKFLAPHVGEVEIPSRMASLYLRMGEEESAQSYYSLAERGLKKMRTASPEAQKTWLPELLFQMGRLTQTELRPVDFDQGLSPIKRSQIYLAQAVDLSAGHWGQLAAKEMAKIYSVGWTAIQSVKVTESEDQLQGLKEQQDKMISMAIVLESSLAGLKQELASINLSQRPFLKQTISELDDYQTRMRSLIATRPVHEGLTPNAQRLESIQREGRVIDPSGVLEKNRPRLPTELPEKKK